MKLAPWMLCARYARSPCHCRIRRIAAGLPAGAHDTHPPIPPPPCMDHGICHIVLRDSVSAPLQNSSTIFCEPSQQHSTWYGPFQS